MTDNEIIKALENCLYYSPSCTICKYDADTLTSSECIGALMNDSLDPINRQKAEIERLKLECYKLYSKGSAYSMQVEASDRTSDKIRSNKRVCGKIEETILFKCRTVCCGCLPY